MTSRKSTSSDGRYPHRTVLTSSRSTVEEAASIASSVGQETDEIADERSRATVDRDGTELRVTVAAADLTALRAAVNTWAGLVGVADQTVASARSEGGASSSSVGSR